NTTANIVEDGLQDVDVHRIETTTKVPSRCGIRNPSGAQGVQEDLVVATQFHVLQTGSLTQGVVGEIEHVIGFVKGSMKLQQFQMPVDGVDEAELASQGMQSTDAAVCHAPSAA